MVKKKRKAVKADELSEFQYCSQPEVIERTFEPGMNQDRLLSVNKYIKFYFLRCRYLNPPGFNYS